MECNVSQGEPGIFERDVIKIGPECLGPECLEQRDYILHVVQPSMYLSLGVYDIHPTCVVGYPLPSLFFLL